jgi:hypothetical protein
MASCRICSFSGKSAIGLVQPRLLVLRYSDLANSLTASSTYFFYDV